MPEMHARTHVLPSVAKRGLCNALTPTVIQLLLTISRNRPTAATTRSRDFQLHKVLKVSVCSFCLFVCSFCLFSTVLQEDKPFWVPLIIALGCVAVIVLLAFAIIRTKFAKRKSGRMRLTANHADTVPNPYPEERTFDNPIYQVGAEITGEAKIGVQTC